MERSRSANFFCQWSQRDLSIDTKSISLRFRHYGSPGLKIWPSCVKNNTDREAIKTPPLDDVKPTLCHGRQEIVLLG